MSPHLALLASTEQLDWGVCVLWSVYSRAEEDTGGTDDVSGLSARSCSEHCGVLVVASAIAHSDDFGLVLIRPLDPLDLVDFVSNHV